MGRLFSRSCCWSLSRFLWVLLLGGAGSEVCLVWYLPPPFASLLTAGPFSWELKPSWDLSVACRSYFCAHSHLGSSQTWSVSSCSKQSFDVEVLLWVFGSLAMPGCLCVALAFPGKVCTARFPGSCTLYLLGHRALAATQSWWALQVPTRFASLNPRGPKTLITFKFVTDLKFGLFVLFFFFSNLRHGSTRLLFVFFFRNTKKKVVALIDITEHLAIPVVKYCFMRPELFKAALPF